MVIQQKTVKGPVILSGIHSSGKSIAVYEGKNNYLDQGIPGEEVLFVSSRNKHGFRSGNITEMINPSPHRVMPFCRHYTDCGGCPWMHMVYSHQLTIKKEILEKALSKYEIPHPQVADVIPSPEIKYFRHRVEYAFAAENHAMGYHKVDTREVTDISECYLQAQPSRRICDFVKTLDAGSIRSMSVRINRQGDALLVLGFTEDPTESHNKLMQTLASKFPEILSINSTVHLSDKHSQMQGKITPYGTMEPFLYETLANLKFRIHASSFFQPNVRQAENIFNTIAKWTDLNGTEKIYDLYTGVGTIALFLAGAREVIGIEGSSVAIEDAIENAKINHIQNARFITGDILKTFTPGFLQNYGIPDIIVLDPPRSGTLIEIKKAINMSGASRVIYLSCNPVSLAFDLKQLTEVYRVTAIQPFDMLPNTHHLETLVMLERKG